MHYSVRDVKASMPREKAEKDSLWVKMWVRRAAYPLSAFALNLGLTPNTISVIAIVVAALGSALLCFSDNFLVIAGMVLVNVFIVFDCMDGTMARTLKKNSYMGEFYDAMGGYVMCAFPLLGAGICVFNSYVDLPVEMRLLVLALGAAGGICDIFSRLVYQKYTVNEMFSLYKLGKPLARENDNFYTNMPKKTSITYWRMVFDRQFGIGGFFPPLLFLCYLVGLLPLVVLAYSLYHIAAFVAVMFLFCRRATRFDQLHERVFQELK